MISTNEISVWPIREHVEDALQKRDRIFHEVFKVSNSSACDITKLIRDAGCVDLADLPSLSRLRTWGRGYSDQTHYQLFRMPVSGTVSLCAAKRSLTFFRNTHSTLRELLAFVAQHKKPVRTALQRHWRIIIIGSDDFNCGGYKFFALTLKGKDIELTVHPDEHAPLITARDLVLLRVASD